VKTLLPFVAMGVGVALAPVIVASEEPSIDGALDVVATATAVRGPTIQLEPFPEPPQTDPPTTQPTFYGAPAGLSNCDEMRWYRINAGLPSRFDAIGWRESNCINSESVHTFCCWGWWQLYVSAHLRDHRLAPRYAACGIYSRYDVDSDTPGDKRRQACGAKALFDVVGYSAWG
jgi:hypothetical protein